MYTDFFSLKQSPFSIAPDPRYLFMSERHREALAHLLYGIESGGGFVLLTGEVGAGKTTVCRCFIEQLPATCRLAYIFNPKLTVEELLQSICDEFRIDVPAQHGGAVSVKRCVDAINLHLLNSHAQGKNNVLVIDEAQNLSADVLEQLRLLTNLETNERKLLQIILIGQPELRAMLARPELEQLAQRVIARYHLGPLSAPETGRYVAHRLAVAGAAGSPFPRRLLPLIHRLSKGVPRRINLLCDRALLGAYVENERELTRVILRKAAMEVFGDNGAASSGLKRHWAAFACAGAAAAAIGGATAWHALPLAARAPPPFVSPLASPAASPAFAPPAASFAHARTDEALRELAALWGLSLPQGEACQLAVTSGLHCHQGKGGLYDLRQLDRPAMLTLRDGQNVAYALLTGLDDMGATLRVQGEQRSISLAALTARFDGEFTTLWKTPPGFRDQVALGDRGPDVDWLGKRLAHWRGGAAPPQGQPFSQSLKELLREFQIEQNLKADGMAGPRTFMRLNQLTGEAEPRLLAAIGAGK